MKQVALSTLVLLSSAAIQQVLAADYGAFPGLRPSYPDQWQPEADDPLSFDIGVRYWYSIGKQEHSVGNFTETMDTRSHTGEAYVRVNDDSTNSFVEAFGGYGVAHDGTYTTNGGPSVSLPAARLGYAGLDFGWLPLGSDHFNFGMITGYQYMNDSPDTGRANFLTGTSVVNVSPGVYELSGGGDSKINNFEIHSAKLGLAGKMDFGNFDIFGEAAAIPYSWVTGTYGALEAQPIGATLAQGSAVAINGHAYGASGKLMLGFRPTENLSIRVGGRASYLTGQYDATWEEVAVVGSGAQRQRYISNNNPFSMLRYGALLEVAGRF
ncbi:hypothetical protein JP75_21320 [Devosia riboflavina]|uniref:Porin n=1 Tax=Devosia riboflavina TaxID=46914 RepID=A0A087LXH0_9HYPH|nr:hypothetical protein [Devosia riboflavina]KFL29323.1 hypothetical protein JP75_21320 [Devosia riboflavina]